MSTFFITTAIDYTNGAPHIGHAYEKVLADVLARYHRLKGDDVFYLTGVDQHGQKVQQSAEKAGVEPQQYVDGITAKFRALWDKLNVRYDGWAATTDERHKECVRTNLQMLWDDKDPATGESRWIYKKSEGGYYSVRQEQFLTDKERGADGEFGPEWQPVEFREEENFYFRLMPHKQWLLDLIDQRSGKKGGQDYQDLQDSQDAAAQSAPSNHVNPENPVSPVPLSTRAASRPFVIPEFRVGELRNAVEKLEGDLCISRPVTRLQWGIPFPESFGAGFVTYVWFDALVNYISFAPGHDPHFTAKTPRRQGDENENLGALASWRFTRWWPPLHVIGKDIMIPAHGVYWPIMLKALGFTDEEMPTLLVHGWWNISGAKMSKSLGNVIDPDLLADKYGAEAVRYYLMTDISTGRDADFFEDRLVQRFNTDLANSLGNLLNRTLNMAAKYRSSFATNAATEFLVQVDALPQLQRQGASEAHPTPFSEIITALVGSYSHFFDGGSRQTGPLTIDGPPHMIDYAIAAIRKICDSANQLVDQQAPWKLAKDPAQADRLDAVLYHLAESLRIIAILLSPVLPNAAHGIFDQLNWKMDEQGQETRFKLADAVWGELGKETGSHQLGAPTPLFPRIEAPKEA